MTARKTHVLDGNEAVASVAYRLNEVIAIYPITPSSSMGELADLWAAGGQTNLWGSIPEIAEMQSEGGVAGAVHGSLQSGALTTTFTASQGLLLMLPNMFKIAGQLLPCVLHIAARSVATHALSIFGDHSDVMATRTTGFAMLCSSNVQTAHDMAAITQTATLASRIPYLHFFDGFRTSHELSDIEMLSDDDLRGLINQELIDAHRQRGLSPERPSLRGTAQNPDVFFQAREASNTYHGNVAAHLTETMGRFEELTGRHYDLLEYAGHPEAETVLVTMGSGAETVRETVEFLGAQGRKVGAIEVRLFRPFPVELLASLLPPTVHRVGVLDRTKEPGATGEPLYQEIVAALAEAEAFADLERASNGQAARHRPAVYGARYGLSSKEFTPAMVAGWLDELDTAKPRRHVTIGIIDDVSGLSVSYDPSFDIEEPGVISAVFFGLGSDGTVGANKNSIKIIGAETDNHVQGYFVYDSKKSGAMTVSHLRFGSQPICAPYLVRNAGFVGCHQFQFLDRLDVLERAAQGATLLINAPYPADEVFSHLPQEAQQQVIDKELTVWAVDADAVARQCGLGGRINTVMQTCFFALSDVMETENAVVHITAATEKTYGKRGADTVRRNHEAVDASLLGLQQIKVPGTADNPRHRVPMVPDSAPDFVRAVTGVMLAGKGDELPVSAFPPDGTWPTGTSRWEKRNIAAAIPIWDGDVCIQCNLCAFVCPHAAIRAAAYDHSQLSAAPDGFPSVGCKVRGLEGKRFTIQVAPEDCTGCSLCVNVCPAKDRTNPRHKAIDMMPHAAHVETEAERWDFFTGITADRPASNGKIDARTSQFSEPLIEFSGACAGCGETPYLKLLTQLFGDRLVIANATGCSSIYGGNLPTTPYTTNAEGRGPAWANSLFEDNAEFGFGMRLAEDQAQGRARALLRELADEVGAELTDQLLHDFNDTDAQRRRIIELRDVLATVDDPRASQLSLLAEHLDPRSIWLVGGDGWAYDIGYGGLDHVLSTRRNVNVIVLDTEVYSNTGGQQSKATPIGAAAKFATAGKAIPKKDLGLEAMSYGHVYVAQIALAANPNQTVKALREAEAHEGPSLIIAQSPCVAHGYDLSRSAEQQRLAVNSGAWPLFRYDPARALNDEPALRLDSRKPSTPISEYMANQTRFRMVERVDRKRYKQLQRVARAEVKRRYALYEQLSQMVVPGVDVADRAAASLALAEADGRIRKKRTPPAQPEATS